MSKILVIAEKPNAGRDIAHVLGVTEDKGNYMENDDYILISRKNYTQLDQVIS